MRDSTETPEMDDGKGPPLGAVLDFMRLLWALDHALQSALTGILKRLEARGLLQRRADPRDARRALFILTPRGRKLDTVRTGIVEQAVRRVLGKDSTKIAAAQEVLHALSDELDAG